MILINLLPHREAARKRRKDQFNVSVVVAALVGAVIAGLVFLWFQSQISSQQQQNQLLEKEVKVLESQIKDIANLEAEIAALRARQQAVEDLQSDRNLPVFLLDELVRLLPEGVYVVNLKQDNLLITLQGVAQSNERVSELLRHLGNDSPWFTKPELVEIVAGNVTLGARDQRRVSNFTMRVKLVRASEAQKAVTADAAAAAVPAASGGAPAAAGAASSASVPVKK